MLISVEHLLSALFEVGISYIYTPGTTLHCSKKSFTSLELFLEVDGAEAVMKRLRVRLSESPTYEFPCWCWSQSDKLVIVSLSASCFRSFSSVLFRSFNMTISIDHIVKSIIEVGKDVISLFRVKNTTCVGSKIQIFNKI